MVDKPKKPQKLRARLPRGLADRGPAEIAATRRMLETIREVFERYGFEPVETPAMEFPMRACSRSRTTTSSGSACAMT
jgi:histidyl-tRNA synthetase